MKIIRITLVEDDDVADDVADEIMLILTKLGRGITVSVYDMKESEVKR